jgi:alanine racemase
VSDAGSPVSAATVDLAAIADNVVLLKQHASGAQVMTVVKANGYGHGAVEVARAALAGGADWLGVASLAEALELRASAIDAPLLAWLHEPHARFDEAISAGIDIGVSDRAQLDSVASAAAALAQAPALVHLKLDTGLGRNGADEPNWTRLFEAAHAHERAGVLRVRGIFSHLSNANDDEDTRQLERFTGALAAAGRAGLRPELRHLASTAATLRLPQTRLDLVRTGIGSYGLSPFGGDQPVLGLRPAMTLASTIVAIVPSVDDSASARSGVIPLGYGDGVPPQAAGRVHVFAAGGPLLVTRVESDHTFVAPTLAGHDVARGDAVTLFGDPALGHTSAEAWADAAGTINYEIVTRLGARVPRRYHS